MSQKWKSKDMRDSISDHGSAEISEVGFSEDGIWNIEYKVFRARTACL